MKKHKAVLRTADFASFLTHDNCRTQHGLRGATATPMPGLILEPEHLGEPRE